MILHCDRKNWKERYDGAICTYTEFEAKGMKYRLLTLEWHEAFQIWNILNMTFLYLQTYASFLKDNNCINYCCQEFVINKDGLSIRWMKVNLIFPKTLLEFFLLLLHLQLISQLLSREINLSQVYVGRHISTCYKRITYWKKEHLLSLIC